MTLGELIIALAMAILCLSPPLSFKPLSPIILSYSENRTLANKIHRINLYRIHNV